MRIVLVFLLFVFLLSCTGLEPAEITSEYVLINHSGVDLSLVLYKKSNDTINIDNNETYSYKKVGDGVGGRPFSCDSLGLIFNSEKKVIYKWLNTSPRNPLLMEPYTETKINKYHYLFQYTFTEQDYLNISN